MRFLSWMKYNWWQQIYFKKKIHPDMDTQLKKQAKTIYQECPTSSCKKYSTNA